jgi:hypothetical protein
MNRNIETFSIVWNGITIDISWEPNWLNLNSTDPTLRAFDAAHLQVRSIEPERAPLPITETGYRSHFTSTEAIAADGGPVAYVEAWLETESQAPEWRRSEQERRQLSLF